MLQPWQAVVNIVPAPEASALPQTNWPVLTFSAVNNFKLCRCVSLFNQVGQVLVSHAYEKIKNLCINPISTGLFLHPISTGGGGKLLPTQSKNCLVSDRSKIFCLLKFFFVKFFKLTIIRL